MKWKYEVCSLNLFPNCNLFEMVATRHRVGGRSGGKERVDIHKSFDFCNEIDIYIFFIHDDQEQVSIIKYLLYVYQYSKLAWLFWIGITAPPYRTWLHDRPQISHTTRKITIIIHGCLAPVYIDSAITWLQRCMCVCVIELTSKRRKLSTCKCSSYSQQ